MPDDFEERMRRLEYAIFGLSGNNGLRSEVRAIREMLEEDRDAKMSGQRALVLALLAAVIALIGTVASLGVALSV